jgi:glycogen debranching enzyme
MQHRRIIKRGPIVLATDENGCIDPSGTSSQGLFLGDTRFLSLFHIRLDDLDPVLLGSSEESLFHASYLHTNPMLSGLPARAIGVLQHNEIEDGTVSIALTLVNWTQNPVGFEISIEIAADFFDSFEARGVMRPKRGELMMPEATSDSLLLRYIGLDEICSSTEVAVTPTMDRFEGQRMYFPITLGANKRTTVRLELTMATAAVDGDSDGAQLGGGPVLGGRGKPDWFEEHSRIATSHAAVEAVLHRSIDDLEILLTEFHDAWVPVAGLPRFAVPFGRDTLVTGLETLCWNPWLSREALVFLAARQGREENSWNYEQPGKIMHEMHTGELARLKEVPFGHFYGSVDSTPLFLLLGAEYVQWTGDLELYRRLKPNFEAAWKWIDQYGDIDGSGYIQYQAHTPPRASSAALTVGLFNQGWKDSSVSVAYADGTMTTDHPVALAEAQAYLYGALHLWGKLYSAMPESEGMREEGVQLLARADRLKRRFNEEFWMPDKGYYAMALDGNHRQVDSITSNPGHCLWTRLIDDGHAGEMAQTLISDPMMSAWGIRTMANTEKAYNPFSYHNGSVWPFENAIIAAGLKRYGFVAESQKVFDALIDASGYFEYRRWPEVYCGVARDIGGALARQPDASRPQAWSAGAIFLLLQMWVGLSPRPFSRQVDITPVLPSCIRELVVESLHIAGGRLSLHLLREGEGSVYVQVTDNPDDLDIIIHPATRDHHRIAHPAPVRELALTH